MPGAGCPCCRGAIFRPTGAELRQQRRAADPWRRQPLVHQWIHRPTGHDVGHRRDGIVLASSDAARAPMARSRFQSAAGGDSLYVGRPGQELRRAGGRELGRRHCERDCDRTGAFVERRAEHRRAGRVAARCRSGVRAVLPVGANGAGGDFCRCVAGGCHGCGNCGRLARFWNRNAARLAGRYSACGWRICTARKRWATSRLNVPSTSTITRSRSRCGSRCWTRPAGRARPGRSARSWYLRCTILPCRCCGTTLATLRKSASRVPAAAVCRCWRAFGAAAESAGAAQRRATVAGVWRRRAA